MFERGIFTSKADIWVHLFPKEYKAYWYWVRHMREYLKESKIAGAIGRSKDGTATGNGIPVSKTLPFIQCLQVPRQMIEYFKWQEMTDRQSGIQGEQVIDWFFSHGGLRFGGWKIRRMDTQKEQMEFGDFEMEFFPRPKIEVKTEMVESGNVYVQTHEYKHNPTIYKGSDGIIHKRQTEMPKFKE